MTTYQPGLRLHPVLRTTGLLTYRFGSFLHTASLSMVTRYRAVAAFLYAGRCVLPTKV